MLQKLVTLLFISGDPIPVATLATLLEVPVQEVEKELPSAVIVLRDVGLDLLQGPEGVTIVTQAQNASLVEAFWKQELQGDLTPAALQVLTLVGYLENPTREEISYVRGVQSSQSIRALTVRGLISRSGEVCTLTTEAMQHLGITDVSQLPDYETIHAELVEKIKVRIM